MRVVSVTEPCNYATPDTALQLSAKKNAFGAPTFKGRRPDRGLEIIEKVRHTSIDLKIRSNGPRADMDRDHPAKDLIFSRGGDGLFLADSS